MFILGVGYHADASACLLKNGELISAISEERINRKKSWFGVPHKSIKSILDLNNLSIKDIDLIATHGVIGGEKNALRYDEIKKSINNSDLDKKLKKTQLDFLNSRFRREQNVYKLRIPNRLRELEKYGIPIKVFSHHHCHAASAYYSNSKKNGYILTMDGWGEDGLSSTLWKVENFRMKKVSESGVLDSLGYFYGSITNSLGYIPHRHEGKILGLAAYAKIKRPLPKIESQFSVDYKNLRFRSHMEKGIYKPQFQNLELDNYLKKFSSEDTAFSAQSVLEKVVCGLVKKISDKNINLFLAGGIFANVKLNQKLKELRNISNVYIFPNMGDGGLSVGAAQLCFTNQLNKLPCKVKSMLLGNEIDDVELVKFLKKKKIQFKFFKNINKKIASLLAKEQIVIRVFGKMEFGPRALGNRSILFGCEDKEVNKWLNKKLKRTEFMPFAPATLEKDAKKMYKKLTGGEIAANFMTMTFDCKQKMQKESPAAVHIDGTARPQIIKKQTYPDFFKTLVEYKKLTGKSSLINTSFNMHEEPIVCSIEDAIRAFHASTIPWLAINNFLIWQKT